MGKYLRVVVGIGLLMGSACTDRQAEEAERMYYVASRDLEEELKTLPEAIERYGEIAERYPETSAGKQARERRRKLMEAQVLLADIDAVVGDSVIVLYRQAYAIVPDYLPVLRRLGKLYYDNTYYLSRTASKLKSKKMADGVLRMWTEQDSIWSGYTFRHLPVDRKWRDRLCRQAVDVARMLQSFKRFDEALEVVNRGIQYGAGEDVIARARVFASYYAFCTQQSEDAIVLAGDALAYESLADKDRARAYHVLGLAYTDMYQKTRELSDLDTAIEALNSSVRINPSSREVKKLLKTLRVERQKLASKPAS